MSEASGGASFDPTHFIMDFLIVASSLSSTNVEIYIHMNNLLYGNNSNGSVGRIASTLAFKSSGARTPAPASKVLRWKDLEAATAEVAAMTGQREALSTRSVFGTEEGRRDVLNGDELWEDERVDVEELFV